MTRGVRFLTAAAAALAVGLPSAAWAVDASPVPSADGSPAAKAASIEDESAKLLRVPKGRPIEWSMEVLDGPRFNLSAYRGKVVFVNVFATWCGPCRHEQRDFVAFADAHPDDTVVIGVTYRELDDTVRAYRKKFHIDYPIAMDRYGRYVPSLFKRDERWGFPTTIVFRPDGTIASAWLDDANRARLETARTAALAPSPAAAAAPDAAR